MILTTDEAIKHWCPFVRLSDDDGNGTYNRRFDRDTPVPEHARCIGERCMAWRYITNDSSVEDRRRIEVYSDVDLDSDTVGYCALAGVPRLDNTA